MELSIAVNTSLIAFSYDATFSAPNHSKYHLLGRSSKVLLVWKAMVSQYLMQISFLCIQEALSSCHALVFVDNKLVGAPLKKAAIKGIDWIYTSDEKAMSRSKDCLRRSVFLEIILLILPKSGALGLNLKCDPSAGLSLNHCMDFR